MRAIPFSKVTRGNWIRFINAYLGGGGCSPRGGHEKAINYRDKLKCRS